MTTQFWMNDPSILLNKEVITELWPKQKMSYNGKLNAITRLILFLTIIGFAFTRSIRILLVGLGTLAAIGILYKIKLGNESNNSEIEGFEEPVFKKKLTFKELRPALNQEFKAGNKRNPFSNVLLTDIMDEPERKAAPPAFNPEVSEDIITSTKRSVQHMNQGIKNTNKQLFGDLYENFELDQSNRVFYSTANTRVANDQGAFGNFLYGVMPSAKESNPLGNLQREKDNFRYTLY